MSVHETNLVKLQTCTVSICPSNLKIHSIIRNNVPTVGVSGWGVSHFALFMRKVFNMNLFQVEYNMSVCYKRTDIIIFHQKTANKHLVDWSQQWIYTTYQGAIETISLDTFPDHILFMKMWKVLKPTKQIKFAWCVKICYNFMVWLAFVQEGQKFIQLTCR